MPQSNNAVSLLCRGFALAIFIAPFVLLPSLSEFANLPQAAWLQLTTFVSLSIFLLSSYRKKEEATIRTSPLLLPMATLLLWCFVGLSYAVNPYEVIKRLLHLLAAGAAFFLVLQLYTSTAKAKILLWAMALSGLGVALIGIAQHLFGLSLIPQIAPPSATFANKNMAAHFVVLTIPAGMILFLLERKKFAYLLPMILALQTTYLIYAQTRASWLALCVELAFFAFFFLRFRKRNSLLHLSSRQKKGLVIGLLMFAGLISLGNGASFSGYKNITSRITQSQAYAKEPGRQVRFALWLNTLAMAKDHLVLGVGLGNFKNHYALYHDAVLKDQSFSVKRQAVDSHNDLLQGLAELGLVGLGLLSWLCLQTLGAVRFCLQDVRQEQQIITGCAVIGLTSFLVVAMFSFPMACSLPPFVAALYLGLLAANSSQTKAVPLPNTKTIGYGVIVVGLLLFAASMNYKELRGDHFLARFINLENEEKWPEAIMVGQKMVKTHPLRHQLLTYLGRAYMKSGNLARAEKSFQISLKTDPADINTIANLGAVYSMTGRENEGIKVLERVVEIYPEHWGALNNLGNIWMKKREYGKAETAFEKAAGAAPKNHLLWYNLGKAALKNGDTEKARYAFNRSIEMEPEWTVVKEMINQFSQ